MIIGLSGTLGAGKDTVAQYLTKKGFQHLSLSDFVREEAKKRTIGLDRDSLRELANDMVKESGGEILAKIALSRKKSKNLVLSSIRRIPEIDYLHKRKDFILLFVDASIKTRYQRMKKRARIGDSLMGFKKFKTQEESEMSGKSSQRLDLCKQKADLFIDNSKDKKYLNKQIEGALKEIYAQEKKKSGKKRLSSQKGSILS